ADHFADPWVPEFARDFLQEKFNKTGKICEQEDMLPIVRGHVQQENAAVASAKKYLFADTCALQSKVYSDIYYGSVDAAIAKAARKHRYDLFFLTAVDVPWEKDDLRDRPNDRENYFQIFRDALDEAEKPYLILEGDRASRLAKAVAIIEELTYAKSLGFTSQDFIQIKEHQVSLSELERQLSFFENGIAKADLDRPATIGDGITHFSEE